jgi:hypothetical protein
MIDSILQVSTQGTDSMIIEYLMRGSITLLFGVVLWGVKILYELRKQQAKKITDLELNFALIKNDIGNADKLKEALDNEYMKDLNEVKDGVKSLIYTVGEMKLDMVDMKASIKHLEENIH